METTDWKLICLSVYSSKLFLLMAEVKRARIRPEGGRAERVELVPIGADGVTRELILESMSTRTFELESAHCYTYDPNEEIKLRSVKGY